MAEDKDYATSEELSMITGFMTLHMKRGTYFAKQLGAFIISQAEHTGKKMLEMALRDGKITEAEIARLIKEYSVKREEIAEIFKFYYDQGIAVDDGAPGENKVFMVTMKGSGIWKMKDYIQKTYGLSVLEVSEATIKLHNARDKSKVKNYDYIG